MSKIYAIIGPTMAMTNYLTEFNFSTPCFSFLTYWFHLPNLYN